MKNKKTLFIVLGVILFVALIILLMIRDKKMAERPFNHFDFPTTLTIENNTGFEDIDTIALVLAHKVFEYDTMHIIVVYIPDHIGSGEVDGEEYMFEAFVQQIPFLPHRYLVLMNKKTSKRKLQEVLSHEFVHIKQYESGDLYVYGNMYDWKGETNRFSDVKYMERPFEKEAFKNQSKIKKELQKHLYE